MEFLGRANAWDIRNFAGRPEAARARRLSIARSGSPAVRPPRAARRCNCPAAEWDGCRAEYRRRNRRVMIGSNPYPTSMRLLCSCIESRIKTPSSLPFFPMPHFAIQAIGDVLDRLAVKRIHQHDRHLRAGGALEIGAISFERLLAGGIELMREIVDVAGGFELRRVEAPAPCRRQSEYGSQSEKSFHEHRTLARL